MGLGLFLAAVDAYVVAGVLPFMVSELGIPIDHLERATPIVSGFLLGYVLAMPLVGALPGRRVRALAYVAALGLFAAGSAVTASAQELPQLVAGRVIQGFAGGATVPMAITLAVELFPGVASYAALGAVAAAQELGNLTGPVYGAAVSDWLAPLGGWRAIFWVNLPLAALCGLLYLVALRRVEVPPSGSGAPSLRWRGAILLGGAMALLVVGLYSDDPAHRPVGPDLPLLAILAGILIAIFIWDQARGRAPLLAAASIRSVTVVGGLAVSLLSGVGLVAALAEVPLMARTFATGSAFRSGFLLVWFLVGVPAGALAGGFLSRPLRLRLPAGAGLGLAAAMFLLMSRWTAADFGAGADRGRTVAVVLLACGVGFGLAIAPVTAAVVGGVLDADRGPASGLVVLARTMGMLVGLSVLAAYGLHRAYDLLGHCPAAGFLDPNSGFLACATNAILVQFHEIFVMAAWASAAAALVAMATLGAPLPRRG